jgi:hypothetical protein
VIPIEFLLPVAGLGAGVAIARGDAWWAQLRAMGRRPRPVTGAEVSDERYQPLGLPLQPESGALWGDPPVLPPVLARSQPPAPGGRGGGVGGASKKAPAAAGGMCQRCRSGAVVGGEALVAVVGDEVVGAVVDVCAVCQAEIKSRRGRAA